MLWLLLLLTACSPTTAPSDDDDSATDDDDSASADDDDATPPPEGTCSDLGAPGVTGTVPCTAPPDGEPWTGDIWQTYLQQGDVIAVTLDTASWDATFDPRVRITDALDYWLAAGDDQCICDHSAGEKYGCAEATYTEEFDEVVRIHVAAFLEDACANGQTGDYVLRVTVNGVVVVPTQTVNDGPTAFDI